MLFPTNQVFKRAQRSSAANLLTATAKMPFSTGEDNLLQLNQVQFDFNVQFEQLFFSIIPSVLFIATSVWRTCSQARKPLMVNAPVFQLFKAV